MREATSFYLDGALFGGIMISCGASLGVISQWLMQVVVHEKRGHSSSSVSWLNILKDRDVREFFLLMLPATLTSGMAQLASLTDLYFASFIPAAAAGLSYAHLIVMAPLGILSSVIILPLLPTFSELEKPTRWPNLMENLKQVVMLCMVIVLPITSAMCVLAEPIISILFQWSTCDSNASALVSSLVLCYSIGSPFYIIRELLVMVFYALGDSQQPSLISMAAIILNAFLDWLFVSKFCLGAQGLALSTSLVTSLSALVLFYLLSRKLSGLLDTMALVGSLLQLVLCCIISGCTTSVIYKMLQYLSSAASFIRFSILKELLSIFLAGSLGICSFLLLAFLRFPELKLKGPFKTFITR
ncbi:hypothetical protein AQUCO_09400027v1 [Aquilegia coerulea]|nr:hypothetical protein AQUCO_09400027v1 [Aquilegia coerulea]